MQNIPSELIITVENYSYITSFKMKGSPDLGQAVMSHLCNKPVCGPYVSDYGHLRYKDNFVQKSRNQKF